MLFDLVGASTFTVTDARLYVPIVTLSIEDNAKLSKLLSEGVKRLFVLTYRDPGFTNRLTADSHWRYFLPRVKTENYNIEIAGKNF